VRKPAIPSAPKDPARARFDSSVKENLEILLGRRGDRIQLLDENASLDDVIAKVNEIIGLLQSE
jgi:hypothetical protein